MARVSTVQQWRVAWRWSSMSPQPIEFVGRLCCGMARLANLAGSRHHLLPVVLRDWQGLMKDLQHRQERIITIPWGAHDFVRNRAADGYYCTCACIFYDGTSRSQAKKLHLAHRAEMATPYCPRPRLT